METETASTAVTALKHALPYIRLYKGQTFVIKAGGEVFEQPAQAQALLEQVGCLAQVGIRVVLVHGGGVQSTRLSEALGLKPQVVNGRRVTDAATLEVSTMTLNGLINTQLVAACRGLNIPAVGLSGVDGGLVQAQKRPPVPRAGQEPLDFGFVGDIVSIQPGVVQALIEAGYVPVISPLSADAEGTLLNINADTVAAALACALKAAKLLLLTKVPGILERKEDHRSLISYTDIGGLQRLVETGALSGGMLPKAQAITHALKGGVPRVHVISSELPDSLLLEIFTNEGSGTLIVSDMHPSAGSEG